MKEFFLDNTFDEIFALNQKRNPLETLKLLQFEPKLIKKLSYQITNENFVNIELELSSVKDADKYMFEGLPSQIFFSERLRFGRGADATSMDIFSQISRGGNERVLVSPSKVGQYKILIFENVFGTALPSALNSRAKVDTFISNLGLDKFLDTMQSPDIRFELFNEMWRIKKINFFKQSDFEFTTYANDCGYQLTLTDDPKAFIVLDAKTEYTSELKEKLRSLFPQLLRCNVGLEFRFWDSLEKYASVDRKVISTRKSQLLTDSCKQLNEFLDSSTVEDKVFKIKRLQNSIAVEKLDKRKESIKSQNFVILSDSQRYKVPGNEYETVILFSGLLGAKCLPFSQFEISEYSSSEGIDSICSYKIEEDDVLKKDVAVEFEYRFSNFFKHQHPHQHVELIVCWEIDVKRTELTTTEYPWLYLLTTPNNTVRIVEIQSFNLRRT